MAGSGKSRANENKRVRQEALREQLAAQGHVQHVNDIAGKLADLGLPMEAVEVQRLKGAADIKLKLISKYLPDLKMQEIDHTSSDGTMSPKDVDSKVVSELAKKLLD